MNSHTRRGPKPFRATVIILTIIALVMPFSVLADAVVVVDDTTLQPVNVGNNNSTNTYSYSFGDDVCLTDTPQKSVHLKLIKSSGGGSNQFRPGTSVNVEVTSTTGLGLSVDSTSVGSIQVPSDWGNENLDAVSPTGVTSVITFDPQNEGQFSGSVTYRASGLNSSGTTGNAITRDVTINVSATVIDCTPAEVETYLSVASATGTYGGETTLSATLSAGGDGVEGASIDFTISGSPVGSATTGTDGTATLVNVSLAGLDAGNYSEAIGASFAGSEGYIASSGAGDLTVLKADGAVSINNIPTDAVYGGNFTPAFDVLGDGTPSVDPLTPGTCTIDEGVVNFVAAGECTLVASVTEGTNHSAATGEPQSFTIGQATATITLGHLEHTYDGDPKAATATTDPAGLETVTITYDGGPDLPVNAGEYEVVATLDNPNYSADPASGTLIITPLEITGSFTAADKTYDGTTDATITGSGVDPAFIQDDDVELVVFNAQFENANAGIGKSVTADLLLRGDDAGNYVLADETASTTADITARSIAVTADSHFKLVGEDDPDLTYQYDEDSLVEGDEFSGELEREPGEVVGTYVIHQGTLDLGANYEIHFDEGTLTIGYGVCVDFDNDKSKKVGATIPVRIELCDSDGNNISSRDITVSAYQLVKISNGASNQVDPEDAGNANPDDNFRFAGDRYIYNLNTRGMSQGTWKMKFEVDGVQHESYYVEIQLKK
jgi:hypothetical protein